MTMVLLKGPCLPLFYIDYITIILQAMPTPKMKQYKREMESWERQLDFIQAENVYLKIRISEILSPDTNTVLLSQAEHFHERMIQQDELISLIRNDLLVLEKILSGDYILQNGTEEKIIQKQTLVKNEMEILELQFRKLLKEFNGYVTQHL
jgi:hypothetical protein